MGVAPCGRCVHADVSLHCAAFCQIIATNKRDECACALGEGLAGCGLIRWVGPERDHIEIRQRREGCTIKRAVDTVCHIGCDLQCSAAVLAGDAGLFSGGLVGWAKAKNRAAPEGGELIALACWARQQLGGEARAADGGHRV